MITFKGTRAKLLSKIHSVVGMASGRVADTGPGRSVLRSIGKAILDDVHRAYVVKAGGGTDEAGIRWKALSPVTIANRKPKTNNTMFRRRERIRREETKKALERFRLSLPESEARRRAAIVGGLKATKTTGMTKAQTFGKGRIEILIETEDLVESLSPGTLTLVGGLFAYAGPGSEDQIFETERGEVAVGTTISYASTHQRGDRSRNIPARPFFPERIPRVWWERWKSKAVTGLRVGIEYVLR